MKHYKNGKNEVYAFEDDGSQDHLISDDLTPISTLEADLITNPPKTISELKSIKTLEINSSFEASMLPIINGIPAIERESWKKQETEARAYIIDGAASTPLIDALAATRGVGKSELVSRIITKADLFATISGQLIGKRQALEDAVNALPESATPEDIAAISW